MNRFCGNCFNESVNDQSICNLCGFNDRTNWDKAPHGLPAGTILNGRYIIGRVLGQGGFGITYTAKDHQSGQIVAVKEFFPDSMATRADRTSVIPFSGDRGEGFVYGKECFLREAQTMAEFIGNPNIVRVYSYFEENETAYFVMEYVDGQSLQDYLKSKGGAIALEEALDILYPVMDALSAVHEKGIIHRDIAPDNIYISRDGTVKLLDFGAARYSLGNVSRSLDVILKHGFAPREQYKRRGRQGPYTDVYSMAATLYYAITGNRPDDALERQDEDDMPLPSSLGARISKAQEDVLLKAMEVDYEKRFQTMKEFRNAFQKASVKPDDKTKVVTPKKQPEKKAEPKITPKKEPKPKHERKPLPKWLIPSISVAFPIILLIIFFSCIYKPPVDVTKNILMPVTEESLNEDSRVFETAIWLRKSIKSIVFLNTMDNLPKSGVVDVSALGNGQVLAWRELGNILYIAAEGPVIAPEDSSYLFSYMENLESIDFGNNLDTSNVKNMEGMFYHCRKIKNIDFSHFNTSNVTNMRVMFYGCWEITNLNLSGFNTSNVTTMESMFSKCVRLKELNLSSFDTSNVTVMSSMFSDCRDLKELNFSSFDTSNVTDMRFMFSGCTNLKELNLSSFDTSNVTNMSSMFSHCSIINELDLSNFNTTKVTSMYAMFSGCTNIEIINLSSFDTENVTNMESMFTLCENLNNLNLSNFNTSNVTDMDEMFCDCGKLTNLEISNFDVSNASFNKMFYNCPAEKPDWYYTK